MFAGGVPQALCSCPLVEEPSLAPLDSEHEIRRTAHWMNAAREHDAILHLHRFGSRSCAQVFLSFFNFQQLSKPF